METSEERAQHAVAATDTTDEEMLNKTVRSEVGNQEES